MNKISNGKYYPYSLACLYTFLVICAGAFIIAVQGIYSINQETRYQLDYAVSAVEEMVDASQRAFDQVMPLAGKPCNDIKDKLVSLVIANSIFQTVSLVKEGRVICSTYQDFINTPAPGIEPAKGGMLFIRNPTVIKQNVVGIVEKTSGNYAALITIDKNTLLSVLHSTETQHDFTLQLAGKWLDKSGEIHEGRGQSDLMAQSKKYDIQVNAGISAGHYFTQIMSRYRISISALILFSVFLGRRVFKVIKEKADIEAMKKGIRNNEFVPYAQPIMNSRGELSGLEVLVRWKHKSKRIIFPDTFIPFAERVGLIIPMTTRLITNTIEEFEKQDALFPDDFHVGINVCASHFSKLNQRSLLESCQEFLASRVGRQTNLVLEVTERSSIESDSEVTAFFNTLNALGVKTAIDDFGTGSSNLAEIKHTHFDIIKIDKTFTDLIGPETQSEPLVDNIIDLARRLGACVVAEGVETQEQVDYFHKNSVRYIQGYIYGKPVPLSEFIKTYL